jgi:signal transduction histidine kinase
LVPRFSYRYVAILVALIGVLAFAANFSTLRASAEPPGPLVLSDPGETYSLAGRWEMLLDPEGSLSIDEVASSTYAHSFEPLADNVSLGYGLDVVWLRFALQRSPEGPIEWRLSARPSFVQFLNLYAPSSDGGFVETRAGSLLPTEPHAIPSREPVFTVHPGVEPAYYYLRLETRSPRALSVRVESPQHYARSVLFADVRVGVLIGMFALSAITGLICAVWLRQRFFWVATAHMLIFGMLQLVLSGYEHHLLDDVLAMLPDLQPGALMGSLSALLGAVHILFELSFLKPQSIYPRAARVLVAMACVSVMICVAAIAGHWFRVAPWSHSYAVLIMVSTTTLNIAMLRHRPQAALLLLCVFTPNMLALMLQLLRNLGVATPFVLTEGLWHITGLFQAPIVAIVILMQVRQEQRQRVQTQQQVQQQKDFIDMMAHELRTPLAILQLATGNLRERLSPGQIVPSGIQPRLDRIDRALCRLSVLVDNALAQQQLGHDEASFMRTPTPPSQLLTQVCSMLPNSERHPISIEPAIAVAAQQSPVPMAQDWMALAIVNLVENAVKYSPDGGAIHIGVAHEEGAWRVEVADEGMGIPPQAAGAASPLFEPLYRAPEARGLSNAHGMGLGLHLVQRVAKAHGGHAFCEARAGGGSVFCISIPAAS